MVTNVSVTIIFFAATLLLLVCTSSSTDEVNAISDPLTDLIDRHETQLQRLESLIDSLSSLLSRLEPATASNLPSSSSSLPPAVVGHQQYGVGSPAAAGHDQQGGGLPAVAVTKHKPAWSDRFVFTAAARLDRSAAATSATALPYEDSIEGPTKYFAIGDSLGRCFVFSSAGDLLLSLPTFSNSSVTSLLSYFKSSGKNESYLIAGHGDGFIVAHRLFEHAANADDWLVLSLAASRVLSRSGEPVVALESYAAGRTRYVVAAEAAGRIRVLTENGTLYGSITASTRPLAFLRVFQQQRLLLLTETGAASLDLRSMFLREIDCDGFNGSHVTTYAFDVLERSKAYGVTAAGDLVHVLILGDSAANIKCRVRAIRKAEFDNGPVALQSIRGYLLAVSHEKVMVYNVSTQFYGRVGAPRPLFFATIQEIRSFFLNADASDPQGSLPSSMAKPLIAADRDKLVILGLGSGYIGIYRASFPVYRVQTNAVVWSAPALLFLLFLIGIWQIYVKKKDSFGWTPEEAFNTTSNSPPGSLLGPAPSDRTFGDSSRPSDLRDSRSSGLRGPTRRYSSPPRYGGGSGIPFRSSSSDSAFRGATDLNYRGRDASPFSQRREPLFSNTQPVDDHAD